MAAAYQKIKLSFWKIFDKGYKFANVNAKKIPFEEKTQFQAPGQARVTEV